MFHFYFMFWIKSETFPLQKICRETRPDKIIVCWDGQGGSTKAPQKSASGSVRHRVYFLPVLRAFAEAVFAFGLLTKGAL